MAATMIYGRTLKGAPIAIPIEKVGGVLDRNQEVHLLVPGIEDGESGPMTVRVTDVDYADVCELLDDYYRMKANA